MLDFFRRLRAQRKLVFLCLHPKDPVHLDILGEVCDRYMFMRKDAQRRSRLLFANTLPELTRDASVRGYLGQLVAG